MFTEFGGKITWEKTDDASFLLWVLVTELAA